MGQPEWEATSYSSVQGKSNSSPTSLGFPNLDVLLKMLADLSTFFHECIRVVRLGEASPPPLADITELWARVRQLQKESRTWREHWDQNYQNGVSATLPITRVKSTHITAWTTSLCFNSVDLAIKFTWYNAVKILLNSIPIYLHKHSIVDASCPTVRTSDFKISDRTPSFASDTKKSIRSICRSIEYYLHSLDPSEAPPDYYLFFPIHVARRASIQLSFFPELHWLDDASEAMKLKYIKGVWANMDFGDQFSGLREGLFG